MENYDHNQGMSINSHINNLYNIKEKLRSSSQHLAIILGGHINGLGLVRGLGEAGISSIVIDHRRDIASVSKYVLCALTCPHPSQQTEAFIAFMLELGGYLTQKGVLFCTNDIWLIPISKFQKKLEPYYKYPMSNWDVIGRCIDKSKLHLLAMEAGVPCPPTFLLHDIFDLARFKEQVVFPCIIKPTVTLGFTEKLNTPGRTLVISDEQELQYWEQRIIESDLISMPLLLQSLIPGGPENLYTLTAYSNVEGEILAYSTGHKIRQSPPDAGTIVSGRVVPEPEVFRLGKKLIHSIGFYGLSNTEFKRDKRDGKFKLIEINPRPGMWNYATTATGINLPYMAYREVLGEIVEKVEAVNTELVWLLLFRDFLVATQGFRKKEYAQYATPVRQWLKSLRGKKVDGVFQIKDLHPWFYDRWLYLKSLINAKSGVTRNQ